MATKIKAVETIIEWDEELYRMAILNPGDTAEVGDGLAAAKVDAKVATLVEADAAPQSDDERDQARARYTELSGKKPFHGWTVDQLNAKIAELEAAADVQAKTDADAAPDQDGEAEAQADDAPPSEDGEDGAPV